MKHILLTENLSIKKPELDNSKDCWVLQKLDEDKTINGDNGYL